MKALSYTLHELVSVMDHFADAFLRREYGVSFTEYSYLAVLDDLGTLDVTTIARCLNLTKAAVSKRLPAMETAGWVGRRVDPTNRRRLSVSLTPAGRTLARTAGRDLEAELLALFAARPGGRAVDHHAVHEDLALVVARLKDLQLTGASASSAARSGQGRVQEGYPAPV